MDVALCRLVGIDRRLSIAYCLHHWGPDRFNDGDRMYFEMSANFYETPRATTQKTVTFSLGIDHGLIVPNPYSQILVPTSFAAL
jgi:hypothetical protein